MILSRSEYDKPVYDFFTPNYQLSGSNSYLAYLFCVLYRAKKRKKYIGIFRRFRVQKQKIGLLDG